MPCKRGAPAGNRNRFVHGGYSKTMMERKAAIRLRKQVVRAVILRVNIICRLREALLHKKKQLLAFRSIRRLSLMVRGKNPRLREPELCVSAKWRWIFKPRREPMEPGFKLLAYWGNHYQKQDYNPATVMRLIAACDIDPFTLLAKCYPPLQRASRVEG
ncbi:MAG TPA: hypothetical protein VGG10_16850 [Rhizomicrobium sp.]|jgi:hypothetical protein